MEKKHFGKYRGTVINNIDPEQRGRLLVQVPDVLGTGLSSWAMPCMPVGGLQMGAFSVPPMQSGVWVEFEQGNPDYPIWTGSWWGSAAEVPSLALTIPPPLEGMVFQTSKQNSFIVSDVPGPTGGIILKTATGASISINETGITIQNGQGASISLTGPTVTVNNGALVVT